MTRILIHDLGPSPLKLLQPIPVDVEEEDGAFVASFTAGGVHASGDTLPEALDMLKDMIAATYQVYCDRETILSDRLKQELAVLRCCIEETQADCR